MSDISTFSLVSEARVIELCGDVWLRVKAPNGSQGAINLTKLSCGPITRKAFVDWALARTDKNVAGSAREPTNERTGRLYAEARVRDLENQVGTLHSFVQDFLDNADEPPRPNCSCHISPPCGDCTEYAGLRDLFDRARILVNKGA